LETWASSATAATETLSWLTNAFARLDFRAQAKLKGVLQMSSESFRKRNGGADLAALLSGNWRLLSLSPTQVKKTVEAVAAAPAEVSLNFEQSKSTDEAKLNKTEKAFLAYLRLLNPPYIGVQNITLKLGDDLRYTPDFNSINENGRFVFWETKGPKLNSKGNPTGIFKDDARVKLLTAARQFRMFDFYLVRKNGTGWDINQVKP
jgi:hypothetical protein